MAASPSLSVNVRSYQPSDLHACQKLMLDGQREYGHSDDYATVAIQTDMADIEQNYLQISNAHYWVAVSTDDNRIIGQVGVQPLCLGDPAYYREVAKEKRDNICELRRMVVVPDTQKLGIGSLLLSTLLDFAREHNYRQVHLTTLANMNKACAFYQKHDFVKGRIERYSLTQGGRDLYEEQKEKESSIDDHMVPVVFEVGVVIPDEDQHRMTLAPGQSKFFYVQHFSRTL